MTEEETQRLNLMRIWLTGTFLIVAVAVALYGGLFAGLAIFRESGYWLIVGTTGVLAAALYFGYRWWLQRT
ncbi:MAG: hypothetical protein ACRDGG_04325 [Anaerolineae bacterium]